MQGSNFALPKSGERGLINEKVTGEEQRRVLNIRFSLLPCHISTALGGH
jgi:hypothetical protein